MVIKFMLAAIKKIKKTNRKVVTEFESTLKTLLISAFGLVAALVWKDAIQALFTDVLGLTWGQDFSSTFIVALIVTLVAVIVTVLLGRKK